MGLVDTTQIKTSNQRLRLWLKISKTDHRTLKTKTIKKTIKKTSKKTLQKTLQKTFQKTFQRLSRSCASTLLISQLTEVTSHLLLNSKQWDHCYWNLFGRTKRRDVDFLRQGLSPKSTITITIVRNKSESLWMRSSHASPTLKCNQLKDAQIRSRNQARQSR